MKRAALVYQAGIANVFEVDSFNIGADAINSYPESCEVRNARRLVQGDFRSCLAFARGLKAAGVKVEVFGCNEAGDITNSVWSTDLASQPFAEKIARKV